jgi:hypothetical protein
LIRARTRSPGARAPGPGPAPRPGLYRLGAYVVYPLLAGGGALLLSRVDGPAGFAAAGALLLGALALPVWLGALCRRCNERPLPRLVRLLVLPAVVCTALAYRSAHGAGQYLAFGLVGASAVFFVLGWRLAERKAAPVKAPPP